jgi:hypothetical protein
VQLERASVKKGSISYSVSETLRKCNKGGEVLSGR